MRRIAAELVSDRSDVRIGHEVAPVSMAPVTRYLHRDRAVTALDWRLAPTASVRVDLPPTSRLLAASPDLDCIVAATGDRLVVLAEGRTRLLPIPAADSATILPSERLVVTAPAAPPATLDGRSHHRVCLVAPTTGQILDEATFPVDDAAVTATPHPGEPAVLLDAGQGQDGSRVLLARVAGDRLAVELVLEDVVAAGFHPSGDRLLITPHPSFEDPVSMLAWPSLEPVATLTPADVDCAGDRFDLMGCFLGPDRVLLRALENGLLLCSTDLQPHAWVDLTAAGADPETEFELMFGVTDDSFAAEVWGDDSPSATVWRVP